MKITKFRKQGFTLIEIMVVVGIIGLLAAIALPNFLRARARAQQNTCINNLRQLDGAKAQWASETRAGANSLPTPASIQPFLGRGSSGSLPYCPQDSSRTFTISYTLGLVSEAPTCNMNGSGQNDLSTPHALPPGAN